MGNHRLDFHSTFRHLVSFKPSLIQPENEPALDDFIGAILTLTPEPNLLDPQRATEDWKNWLTVYSRRIESEREEWTQGKLDIDVDTERERETREVNPRFVLRQWVLEEVIRAVEKDAKSGNRVLRKVLQVSQRVLVEHVRVGHLPRFKQMACNPFEPWGAEGSSEGDGLDEEAKEERRFCGIGEQRMLGFQCSCSS